MSEFPDFIGDFTEDEPTDRKGVAMSIADFALAMRSRRMVLRHRT
jgi:hypothetical protein